MQIDPSNLSFNGVKPNPIDSCIIEAVQTAAHRKRNLAIVYPFPRCPIIPHLALAVRQVLLGNQMYGVSTANLPQVVIFTGQRRLYTEILSGLKAGTTPIRTMARAIYHRSFDEEPEELLHTPSESKRLESPTIIISPDLTRPPPALAKIAIVDLGGADDKTLDLVGEYLAAQRGTFESTFIVAPVGLRSAVRRFSQKRNKFPLLSFHPGLIRRITETGAVWIGKDGSPRSIPGSKFPEDLVRNVGLVRIGEEPLGNQLSELLFLVRTTEKPAAIDPADFADVRRAIVRTTKLACPPSVLIAEQELLDRLGLPGTLAEDQRKLEFLAPRNALARQVKYYVERAHNDLENQRGKPEALVRLVSHHAKQGDAVVILAHSRTEKAAIEAWLEQRLKLAASKLPVSVSQYSDPIPQSSSRPVTAIHTWLDLRNSNLPDWFNSPEVGRHRVLAYAFEIGWTIKGLRVLRRELDQLYISDNIEALQHTYGKIGANQRAQLFKDFLEERRKGMNAIPPIAVEDEGTEGRYVFAPYSELLSQAEETAEDVLTSTLRSPPSRSIPRLQASLDIEFEDATTLEMRPDSVVDVFRVDSVVTSTAKKIKPGDLLVFVREDYHQGLYELVLERLHSTKLRDDVDLVLSWRRGIQEHLIAKPRDLADVWEELTKRGVTVTSMSTVKDWVRGGVNAPLDAQNLRLLGEVLDEPLLKYSYDRIHKAASNIHRIHIKVAKLVGDNLRSLLRGRMPELATEDFDPMLGITFQELFGQLEYRKVKEVRARDAITAPAR